jgi:hypothetical protein
MAIIDWPESPMADLYTSTKIPSSGYKVYDWHYVEAARQFAAGSAIRIRVRWSKGTVIPDKNPKSGRFETKVDVVDNQNNVTSAVIYENGQLGANEERLIEAVVPMAGSLVRRVFGSISGFWLLHRTRAWLDSR